MMNNTLLLYFQREWQLMFRNTSSLIQPLVFFIIIALLFPFSLPAEADLLQRIGGGVIWVLFIGLLLGTPSLSLIGAIGAALTVTLRRGGVLIAIIILPLYIPILIFGAGMLSQSAQGLEVTSQLYALAAISVLSLTLTPFAVAGALRLTIN